MTADCPDRFFPTTLLGDFLHVRGIPDWGPWRTGGFEHTHEPFPGTPLGLPTRDVRPRGVL